MKYDSKLLRLDKANRREQMEKKKPSEAAKRHFDHEPYSAIRGDTSGQENSK